MHKDLHRSSREQLMQLARASVARGDDAYALSLYQAAMSLVNESEALEHPDVAECLVNTAQIYLKENRFKEAEANLRLALFIYERLSGYQKNIKQLSGLLALACRWQGHFADARTVDDIATTHSTSVNHPLLPVPYHDLHGAIYKPHQIIANHARASSA